MKPILVGCPGNDESAFVRFRLVARFSREAWAPSHGWWLLAITAHLGVTHLTDGSRRFVQH
jgi:hypothetical protein